MKPKTIAEVINVLHDIHTTKFRAYTGNLSADQEHENACLIRAIAIVRASRSTWDYTGKAARKGRAK